MKRWLAILVAVLVAAGLFYVLGNRADDAAGTAPALAGAPASASVLVRGEYLTRAADCIACHTVPGSGRSFAGGVAFKLPVGVIYSTNITADPVNGIGAWSDAEFVRAVQGGVGRNGEHLYPAFPYTSYTRMSRDDILAIRAYLAVQRPVSQPNHVNDLAFPFNQRWAVGFWNAAFFKAERFAPDASRSPQWNAGAYLATALGHCGECHTPRNAAFGLRHGEEFAGAELEGWRAYNITSDAKYGIGAWRPQDIAAYLKTGFAAGHAVAGGPMSEAVAHSLQYLDDADLDALVAYLRDVPARAGLHRIDVDAAPATLAASTALGPAPSEDAAHAQGLHLFEGACASCHRWDGGGRQSPYAALVGTRGVNDAEGGNVTEAILQGADVSVGDRHVYMPAFAAYSNTEVAALANFVIGQFGGKAGQVTPDMVAKRRDE